jgi:dienelactone hydrolase
VLVALKGFWGTLLLLALGLASAGPAAAASGAVTTALHADQADGGAGLDPPIGAQHYGVGEMIVTFTDFSRRVWIPGRGPEPRQLTTIIRYPAATTGSGADAWYARPVRARGPFPLVVFAHGYDITPTPYAPLLRAWASSGYVVAAPIFPLTNPAAPGGPNESDLVNQPTDMSFVISQVLAASASGRGALRGLVDSRRVAVAGQSDGGSTALAVAYNSHYFDRRIAAAMILSGAMIPGLGGYVFPSPNPPLLAVQGTGDTVNAPASTYHFFGLARRPKFLLSLLGAPHLGPYTDEQPQLGIVERVTTAFLDRFLTHVRSAGRRMWRAGSVPRLSRLTT